MNVVIVQVRVLSKGVTQGAGLPAYGHSLQPQASVGKGSYIASAYAEEAATRRQQAHSA